MSHYTSYISKFERNVNLIVKWKCPSCERMQISLNQVKLRSKANRWGSDTSTKEAAGKMREYSEKLNRAVRNRSLQKLKLRAKCEYCHKRPLWSWYVFTRRFDRISYFWFFLIVALLICFVMEPESWILPIALFSGICAPFIFKFVWNSILNVKMKKTPDDLWPQLGYLMDEKEAMNELKSAERSGILFNDKPRINPEIQSLFSERDMKE